MRVRMTKAAAVVAMAVMGLAGVARPAQAAGPDAKYIPADAKWLVHIDVDQLARTQTYGIVMAEAEKDEPNVREKLAKFGEALGTRFPEEVHGVTLIGRAFDERSAVLVVRAKLDRDRLLGMAKALPGFTSADHRGAELINLNIHDEKGTPVSGAFLADDVLVLGWTPVDVGRMLDLAAGREKPAAAAEGLLGAGAAGATTAATTGPATAAAVGGDGAVIAYLAADGLAELQRKFPVSPLISQVTAARLSLAERGDDLALRAVLNVTSPEIAKQVKGALEGFKALLGLAALDDSGDKDAKALAAISTRAAVAAEGSTVTLDWPVPLARVRELVEEDAGKKRAAEARRDDAEKAARAARDKARGDVEEKAKRSEKDEEK